MSNVISDQIRKLVANDRTEDALNLLAQHHRDAINLLAQFRHAKRQNNLGLMNNAEWFQLNGRINNSVLELANIVWPTVVSVQQTVVVWLDTSDLPSTLKGKLRVMYERLEQAVDDEDLNLSKIERFVELLHEHFTCEITVNLTDEVFTIFKIPSFSRLDENAKQQKFADFVAVLLELREEFEKAAAEVTTISRQKSAKQLWIDFQAQPTKTGFETIESAITAEIQATRNRQLLPKWEDAKKELETFEGLNELLWKLKTANTRKGMTLIIDQMV